MYCFDYKNNGKVYQLGCFCCIISLTYKATLFRIVLCANLLYMRKRLVRYFFQKVVKWCIIYSNHYSFLPHILALQKKTSLALKSSVNSDLSTNRIKDNRLVFHRYFSNLIAIFCKLLFVF